MVPEDLILNNTIQIVYDPSNAAAPPVEYDAVAVLDDTEFVPLVSREMIDFDIEFTLNAFFDVSRASPYGSVRELTHQTYDDGTNRASFNNVTYQMPHTPSIFTALSMGNDAFNSEVYGSQTNAFAYPHMARVQLTVFNWDA